MLAKLLLLNAALAGDRDADGLKNKIDACPNQAEDLDAYEDEDGCPEPTSVLIKVRDSDGFLYPGATWNLAGDEGRSGDERSLATGRYTFWVEGYPSTTQVPAGEPTSVYLEIPAPRGELAVQAVDVFGNLIDADFIAEGPHRVEHRCNRDVLMRPGTWTVRVTAAGYDPVEGRAYVREGETVVVEALMHEAVKDRDGDGTPDDVDYCPDGQEDMDGVDDDDGCPDSGVADF